MENIKKVAIVTGATLGIGRAIAQKFHDAGMIVVVTGRDGESAKAVADEIDAGRHTAIGMKADVRKIADVESMVKKTADAFGRLNVLVNNAGITRDNLIFNTTVEDWQEVMDTNLNGPFLCTKYAAREMMHGGWGRIINISSIAARGGGAGQASYAASKSGLNALTRVSAVEMGRKNITVNAIAPGSIKTKMSEEFLKKREDEIVKKIPLRRVGLPEEIAGIALFLTSEEASYMTGQIIHVTGGLGVTHKL